MKVTLATINALADSIIQAKPRIEPETKSLTINDEVVLLVDLQKDFFSSEISSSESLIINGKFIADIDPWTYTVDGEVADAIRRGVVNVIRDSDDFNNRLDFLLNDLFTNKFAAAGTLNCNIHNVPGTDINYVEVTEAGVNIYRCFISVLDKATSNIEPFLAKALIDQILKGNIEAVI